MKARLRLIGRLKKHVRSGERRMSGKLNSPWCFIICVSNNSRSLDQSGILVFHAPWLLEGGRAYHIHSSTLLPGHDLDFSIEHQLISSLSFASISSPFALRFFFFLLSHSHLEQNKQNKTKAQRRGHSCEDRSGEGHWMDCRCGGGQKGQMGEE